MARQEIYIGSAGNDGTGDTLRSGGKKINDNFSELYQDVAAMQLLVADSSGGVNLEGITFDQRSVVFIGVDSQNSTPADNFETYLSAAEPTKDNQIVLPDSSGRVALITDIRDIMLDSAEVLDVIGSYLDSALALQLINEHSIDSTGVVNLVDAAYIQTRQSPSGLDSTHVGYFINDLVNQSYILNLGIVDSGKVQGIIESNFGDLSFSLNPGANNINLGTATQGFRDAFIDRELHIDSAKFTYAPGGTNTLLLENVKLFKIINQDTSDSARLRLGKINGHPVLSLQSHFTPAVDSAFDLGDSNFKWRDLHLSGSTINLGGVKLKATGGGTGIRVEDNGGSEINLGGGLTQSQVDGRIVAFGTVTQDSAKELDDSAFARFVPAGNAGDLTIISGDGTNSLSTKVILETSDKFFDDSADVDRGKLDRPTNQDVFNTWRRLSHNTSGSYPADLSEANSWSYNSGTDTISSTVNSGTFIGFASKDKYKNYDFVADLSSTSADDDLVGLIAGFDRPSIDSEYTLTVFRTGGGLLSSTYGLVYNAGQSDQAVLVDGGSTISVSGPNNAWSTTGATKVSIVKRGKTLTFTTSQQPSTTLDNSTTLTFDLSSDSRTQRFVGKTRYGYAAWSQDAATFSNNVFTPTDPVKLIHFNGTNTDNFGGDIYTYDAPNTIWGIDSSISLADDPGRFFHNTQTGRTFYVGVAEDGYEGYAVGTVRQFNDILYMKPLAYEPDSASTGTLGKQPGSFAMADGVNWDPASKSGTVPYPVLWDGNQWNALY